MLAEERTVSVEQFAYDLMKQSGRNEEDVISYGYRTGWLEDMEFTGRKCTLDKRTAARIVHQFMRFELREQELLDISSAGELADLYDCRSCVMHVAQMYCKGIMEAIRCEDGRFIFGMDRSVNAGESFEILERVFNPEKRVPRVKVAKEDRKAEVISLHKAQEYLRTDKNALLIDVRSLQDYRDRHMQNAIHIPLNDVLKNPYMVCEHRDRRLLLYCEEGCQSAMAAQCMISAGYQNVCSFAWDSNKQ